MVDLILWRDSGASSVFTALVSILVLVDLILWLISKCIMVYLSLSFNPCFGGSYIMTTVGHRYQVPFRMFQSLFWWILYYDHDESYPRKLVHEFQSLFWWILYYDSLYGRIISKDAGVSILVLVDLILWRKCWNYNIYKDYIVSILVLVDLILWQNVLNRKCHIILSFNPCFGGSYIMTTIGAMTGIALGSFNPCFGGSYIMTFFF